MIIIKRLDSPALIEDACALLYQVYYEEVVWKFSPDNPSQLRIETRNNRNLLVDRFTDKAVWFGAFDDSKLVGCGRLTFVDENNKLEMESYKNSWIIQRYLPEDKSHCAELTRSAVLPNYRGRGVVRHLFLAIFQYCEDHQYSVCATPNHGYIVKLLKEIGWPLKMELAFKYEEHDPLPVNFNFANYAKSEVKNVILNLASYKTGVNPNHAKILDALEVAAPILPTPVYWHDRKGITLGINALCLKAIGATRDIIGKTPYEFYPREVAEHVLKHNEEVIRTGEILSQDEPMKDITTGETKVFRSIKAPLCDDDGKIIGIIGSSIEVTAEKEAERLKIENEKQKTLLEQEERFTKLANQVAHDIRSPLASLLMIVKSCTQIPEADRIALREAAMGIGDIANHLLYQYRKHEADSDETEERQAILVSTVLLELLTAKKYQYQKLPIKLDCHFKQDTQFSFIKIAPSAFKRALSNLINNAVDAFENNTGKVELQLEANDEWVKISIRDTGKGMPEELVDKIKNRISVTEGKKTGHGIGLTQVWETLDRNHGEMHIDSKLGKGTAITLTFPRIKAPAWIAEEIVLIQNDIVVILDDDASIHHAWRTRFTSILDKENSIQLEHFEKGKEALDFINTFNAIERQNIFLLTDYELLKQELNGLHIIAQSGIKRSILVTSHYADTLIQKQAIKTNTKILPKQLASEIPVTILQTEPQSKAHNVHSKVDAVLVDDDEGFSDKLVLYVFGDKIVDQYLNPEALLKNIHRYSKDTKIYLDNNYQNSSRKGLDVAEELHEQGYERLYLLSGEVFAEGKVPSYLMVLRKDDIEGIEKSL